MATVMDEIDNIINGVSDLNVHSNHTKKKEYKHNVSDKRVYTNHTKNQYKSHTSDAHDHVFDEDEDDVSQETDSNDIVDDFINLCKSLEQRLNKMNTNTKDVLTKISIWHQDWGRAAHQCEIFLEDTKNMYEKAMKNNNVAKAKKIKVIQNNFRMEYISWLHRLINKADKKFTQIKFIYFKKKR